MPRFCTDVCVFPALAICIGGGFWLSNIGGGIAGNVQANLKWLGMVRALREDEGGVNHMSPAGQAPVGKKVSDFVSQVSVLVGRHELDSNNQTPVPADEIWRPRIQSHCISYQEFVQELDFSYAFSGHIIHNRPDVECCAFGGNIFPSHQAISAVLLGIHLFVGGSVLGFRGYSEDFKSFTAENGRLAPRLQELNRKSASSGGSLSEAEIAERDAYMQAQQEFDYVMKGDADLGYMGYFGVAIHTGIRYMLPHKMYRFYLQNHSGEKFTGLVYYSDGTFSGETPSVGTLDRWGWGLEATIFQGIRDSGPTRFGIGAVGFFAEFAKAA